jgi:hypothetical protein
MTIFDDDSEVFFVSFDIKGLGDFIGSGIVINDPVRASDMVAAPGPSPGNWLGSGTTSQHLSNRDEPRQG